MSAQRYRPVVIAMAIMWVMQPAVHKVVDVITVRHLFVSAARTMRLRAPGFGRTAQRVGIAHLDNMFVDMISMHMMQMTVVQIIDMVLMVAQPCAHSWDHVDVCDQDDAARCRWPWVCSSFLGLVWSSFAMPLTV